MTQQLAFLNTRNMKMQATPWTGLITTPAEFHRGSHTPGLGQGQRALHGVVKTRRLGASEAILDTGYLRLLVLIVTVSSECWDQIKSSICIVETKYDCPSLTSSMKPRSRA